MCRKNFAEYDVKLRSDHSPYVLGFGLKSFEDFGPKINFKKKWKRAQKILKKIFVQVSFYNTWDKLKLKK